MDNADKMERVCRYLRLIQRTRLLKNTTDELAHLVGFSINSGNGLARMGGRSYFIKDAIFRELAHIVSEKTELDLQDVLDTYADADRIYERLGKVADPNTFCQHLIWHFYGDAEATEDITAIADQLETKQLPILILLLLKALPQPNAKGGDVKDIVSDYQHVLKLLSETVNRNIMMQKLPLLTQVEDDVKKNAKDMCRIHLLSITNKILNSYGSLSTRQRISLSNKELLETQFHPEMEGIWVENELSTVFWQFNSIANGHHLCQYQLDSNRRVLTFTKYFVKFFIMENYLMMLVIHPHAIRYLISGRALPNNLFAYLECEMKIESHPTDIISLTPLSEDGRWFTLRQLRRSKNEEFFKKLLYNGLYEKINKHVSDDYDFNISLAAITEEFVYINKDDSTYYKVPKSLNELLLNVEFDNTVGVLLFRNNQNTQLHSYVVFDDFNLYYNVSTPELMAEHHIEIVNSIS